MAALTVDWKQLVSAVCMGGVEQAVLDLDSGELVYRMLTDGSWESDDVAHRVRARPKRFADLPHPPESERKKWRTAFVKKHRALKAAPLDRTGFDAAVRKARLTGAWKAFQEELVTALLRAWLERRGLQATT